MAAERVLSVHGTRDGIRFGEVQFSDNVKRRYQFDRFSGGVVLFWMASAAGDPTPEVDPRRLRGARRILTAAIGLVVPL